MAGKEDDLDIGHLFRVIFMQGGQVAIGTAIGAGVVLLLGIIGVALSPILLPIYAIWYWRREKQKQKAAATTVGPQDVSDLVQEPTDAPSGSQRYGLRSVEK